MVRARPHGWTVIDLFSGAGGMAYGFHAHRSFQVVGAVDMQVGKPSCGIGTLECNQTFKANMGIEPIELDLSVTDPRGLKNALGQHFDVANPNILIACAPCTGFSRTLNKNHGTDDPRNSLVGRSALFVRELGPEIFLMENARELIMGKFSHHYQSLRDVLENSGYRVHGEVHTLSRVGLPQKRERAIVIAVRNDLPLRTLADLWKGYRVKDEATHVRRAISWLPPVEAGDSHPSDDLHVSPMIKSKNMRRLQLTPTDGGSWADLKDSPEAQELLTRSMRRYVSQGKLGSHPDVYGRLWWDRPAITIKRECAHIGNGRYSHPEQNRLCTVREMSILQGFPGDHKFVASRISNIYRHIGDAVPPLTAYQLASLCEWILTDKKPDIRTVVLPNTNLNHDDIVEDEGFADQPHLPLVAYS